MLDDSAAAAGFPRNLNKYCRASCRVEKSA
jgi:hypothetical protein